MVSIMGKKIASSGFFWCFWKIRLYTCGMPIFDGKHGSMAPRPAPARYMSWPVNSEYTRFSGSRPKLSRYALNSGA